MNPELIADYACDVGEGPLWNPVDHQLYWVDWTTGSLFRFDPSTGKHERCHRGRSIGGFTIQQDGTILLFMDGPSVAIWKNGEMRYVVNHVPDSENMHFNDVIADPEGRVFCGTVSKIRDDIKNGAGKLYRLNTDGTLIPLVKNVGISNGLGFTPNRKGLYYTDSYAHTIYLFDYERETGEIRNQRVWIETPNDGSLPDGLTVDSNGDVWSARWDGSALYQYTADGNEKQRIDFPVLKVSSVTFGGPNYSDIYVTTAGGQNKTYEGTNAGALFRIRNGGQGVAEFASRIYL
mgnify:CR=1 FL=1